MSQIISLDTIRATMSDFIQALSGLPTIIAEVDNTTRPPLPFLAIKVNDPDGEGFDYRGMNADGDFEQLGTRTIMVNVQGIGDGSHDAMRKIITGIQLEGVSDIINSNGFSVYNWSKIHTLSWQDNSLWKEKHSMDLSVRFAEQIIDTSIGWIESITDMIGTMTHFNNDPKPRIINVEVLT